MVKFYTGEDKMVDKIHIISDKTERKLKYNTGLVEKANRVVEEAERKKKLNEKLSIKQKTKQEGKSGLVYSSGNKIFLHVPGEEDVIIAERISLVTVLYCHYGKLYDSGHYKIIYETLNNKEIAERENIVWALCSHDGKL